MAKGGNKIFICQTCGQNHMFTDSEMEKRYKEIACSVCKSKTLEKVKKV